jgi:hypothetical protein
VEYATCVSLARCGDDAKYVARVLAVGTECDIALLTVGDDAVRTRAHRGCVWLCVAVLCWRNVRCG